MSNPRNRYEADGEQADVGDPTAQDDSQSVLDSGEDGASAHPAAEAPPRKRNPLPFIIFGAVIVLGVGAGIFYTLMSSPQQSAAIEDPMAPALEATAPVAAQDLADLAASDLPADGAAAPLQASQDAPALERPLQDAGVPTQLNPMQPAVQPVVPAADAGQGGGLAAENQQLRTNVQTLRAEVNRLTAEVARLNAALEAANRQLAAAPARQAARQAAPRVARQSSTPQSAPANRSAEPKEVVVSPARPAMADPMPGLRLRAVNPTTGPDMQAWVVVSVPGGDQIRVVAAGDEIAGARVRAIHVDRIETDRGVIR